MIRKQIQFTVEEIASLEDIAKKKRKTLTEVIHEGISQLLNSSTSNKSEEVKKRALAAIGRFHSERKDLSKHHDHYYLETLGS